MSGTNARALYILNHMFLIKQGSLEKSLPTSLDGLAAEGLPAGILRYHTQGDGHMQSSHGLKQFLLKINLWTLM